MTSCSEHAYGTGPVEWPGDLGPGLLPVMMMRYPHMLHLDTIVWSGFLEEGHSPIRRVWYDVKVGTPIALPPGASQSDRALAIGTGCRRIDAVAEMPHCLWVIEVKPLGDHVSLGQVLVYVKLFREKFRTAVPVVPLVVCGEMDADIESLFRMYDIEFYVLTQSPF